MNTQKLAYDLALVYAQAQYTQALAENRVVVEPDNPQYPSHSSLLTEAFTDMYIELLNSPGLFEGLQEWEPKLLDTD